MKVAEVDKMTTQEAADYAVRMLVKQGGQSKKRSVLEELCAYRSQDGSRHCGIGWLLDKNDEMLMNYTGGLSSLVGAYPERLPLLIRENRGLFELLQEFHDTTSATRRRYVLGGLNIYGIDTSAQWYQQWITM
jgi:hypothetical protein